jgi:hypothetical protein
VLKVIADVGVHLSDEIVACSEAADQEHFLVCEIVELGFIALWTGEHS